VKVSSASLQRQIAHSVPSPKLKHSAGVLFVVRSLWSEPRSKKAMAKAELKGRKWQSQSKGEQAIINSTSLPGRFMRDGEKRFPWRKDKEADYAILYFIVLPEKDLRALFSALIFCVKH